MARPSRAGRSSLETAARATPPALSLFERSFAFALLANNNENPDESSSLRLFFQNFGALFNQTNGSEGLIQGRLPRARRHRQGGVWRCLQDHAPLRQEGSCSEARINKQATDFVFQILVWKEIDFGGMNEPEKEALVREVNLLRELQHPNIVRYYDRIIDRENATLYIVMEYCDGGDLATMIKRNKRYR